MVQYIAKPLLKTVPHLGKLNLQTLIAYTPNLAFWTVASTFGLFTYTEGIPAFQDAIYKKLPLIGNHWINEVDPEDQPF
ncbi:hypothetical protein BON22_2731 [Cyberlindnera fabianii]|uniref:Cytochrome b-c1 complex subunit 10 n=1 Tax=Cyberlindnera fabianii TaxID=36022 RepID=A0A1V2L7B8_CYBFA|nr:hypothetical protein BON22_2731 [Cyberlindnera fabianii]